MKELPHVVLTFLTFYCSRAQSYAERLRLGLAVIHGEAQCSESDMADGRHSPPCVRNTTGHTGLELPCKYTHLSRAFFFSYRRSTVWQILPVHITHSADKKYPFHLEVFTFRVVFVLFCFSLQIWLGSDRTCQVMLEGYCSLMVILWWP